MNEAAKRTMNETAKETMNETANKNNENVQRTMNENAKRKLNDKAAKQSMRTQIPDERRPVPQAWNTGKFIFWVEQGKEQCMRQQREQ